MLRVQGEVKRQAYFPQGKWYSLFDNSTIDASEGGRSETLELPLGQLGLHMPAGYIIPMQQPALVTADVRVSNLTLVVALPAMRPLPEAQHIPVVRSGTPSLNDSTSFSSQMGLQQAMNEVGVSSVSRKLLSDAVQEAEQPAGQQEAQQLITCGVSEPGLSTACGKMYMDDGDQLEVSPQT